jgi:hypothetical protein
MTVATGLLKFSTADAEDTGYVNVHAAKDLKIARRTPAQSSHGSAAILLYGMEKLRVHRTTAPGDNRRSSIPASHSSRLLNQMRTGSLTPLAKS